MRLVPATNSQKSSGPRLNYKAFVGAKPAPLGRRTCGNRLRQFPSRNGLRLRPSTGPTRSTSGGFCQPALNDKSTGNWRTLRKRWRFGPHLYSIVSAAAPSRCVWSNPVGPWSTCSPSIRTWCCSRCIPPHGRTVSADVLPFWRQRRSERYGIAAGSVVATSGSLAPTANGRRGNPLVAICGGRSTANGREMLGP